MNYSPLRKTGRYRVTEGMPRFSWAVKAAHQNAVQKSYSLQIYSGDHILWDTGWIETEQQYFQYDGAPLPAEQKLTVRITVQDDRGDKSLPADETFYVSGLDRETPGWIAASEDVPEKTVYFRKDFTLSGEVKSAVLYSCGLGYHKLYLNGKAIDDAVLDPLHSDYTKTCYYTMLPDLQDSLKQGANCLGIMLGEGWRRNKGVYSLSFMEGRTINFFGLPQLSASLRIQYTDGREEIYNTDESWQWSHGALVSNNLFNGETYDASQTCCGWNEPDGQLVGFVAAVKVPTPGGQSRVMTMEPITEHEKFPVKTITMLDENTCLVDFGVNIAGYCRIRLPKGMKSGQTISIQHAEMLDEDGSAFTEPLRSAAATDTYIAAGDERDLDEWQPLFTYHGFRYAQITGWPLITKDDIVAISVYSDIDTVNFFTCGSALVNTIQKNLVQTEKDNLVGILTDCPQRDERQGWMNDATARFEETPYNFNIGKLFPKVVKDILDVQGEDGSITCTAPYVFGTRPADPVCSAFLIAGLEALMHTGNLDIIREAYDGFAKWEDFLVENSIDYIVNYTYYGDWASPGYACWNGDMNEARSGVTPGVFMSTGYSYYNSVLLARFAEMLGRTQDQQRYAAQAEKIKAAMLEKWWDAETGKIATASQACQSFALWLGILPENKRSLAALRLHEDLVANDYRITTGNLCTLYMLCVLADYGYVEDAWAILTREEYPSFGYMIQNEATTIWERFELSKMARMNSHNHPMYGSVGHWLYAYLAGIKPVSPGFDEVNIRPYFPKSLLSAQASIQTVKGELTVRWVKRYEKTSLYVTVPFGMIANVTFAGETYKVGSGFWTYEVEEGREQG